LQNNGIAYEEKSISKEENRQALFDLGYKTTPVIVGEKGMVVGYSPAKLSEVLL
jgi:arsenate reductase-like glutaredoxin family protein